MAPLWQSMSLTVFFYTPDMSHFTWLIATPDTSLRQSVKLDIPGEDYFLTTFEEHDVEAVREIMAFDGVNNNLIAVPKP